MAIAACSTASAQDNTMTDGSREPGGRGPGTAEGPEKRLTTNVGLALTGEDRLQDRGARDYGTWSEYVYMPRACAVRYMQRGVQRIDAPIARYTLYIRTAEHVRSHGNHAHAVACL